LLARHDEGGIEVAKAKVEARYLNGGVRTDTGAPGTADAAAEKFIFG
jgi:hypothetical protein